MMFFNAYLNHAESAATLLGWTACCARPKLTAEAEDIQLPDVCILTVKWKTHNLIS